MLKKLSIAIIILTLLTVVVMVRADPGKDKLMELFIIEYSELEDLFDPSFLSQVPVQELILILEQYKGVLGELNKVTGSSGNYTLHFKKGTAPAQIVLNIDEKIIGLWFGNWTLFDDDLVGILSEFQSIDSDVSIAVIKNNQDEILTHNPDHKMAVGSTFKLYVLKAVYDEVERSEINWDNVVNIKNEDKSLPSGILQNWTECTPLTIKTLTNLMISLSDNTATDILINTIGRKKIEEYVDELNTPFLKTSEIFKLKYVVTPAVRQEYIENDIKRKRRILIDLKDLDLDISSISLSPVLIDKLEWFFSARELCKIIYELQEADELRINPGLAVKDDWYMVGYKGGSEPGVLQYTHLLQKEAGTDIYTVSVTANNPDQKIDSNKITELTSRLISLIKDEKI